MKKTIHTAYITLKNGKILRASEVGKRCFVFDVDDDNDDDKQPKLPGMK